MTESERLNRLEKDLQRLFARIDAVENEIKEAERIAYQRGLIDGMTHLIAEDHRIR